jgi:hydrogenase nickel incorporation protein HypA/HybF
MPAAIAFCFDVVAKDSPLEGASLDIVEVSGRARCRACQVEFDVENLFTPCACGSRSVATLQGEELMIKTIDVEEAA